MILQAFQPVRGIVLNLDSVTLGIMNMRKGVVDRYVARTFELTKKEYVSSVKFMMYHFCLIYNVTIVIILKITKHTLIFCLMLVRFRVCNI